MSDNGQPPSAITKREDDPIMAPVRDSVDLNTMAEPELLIFAYKYMERIRAHPRLVEAVRRAALRLVNGARQGG